MKVELIAYTPNPEQVVASAFKLCYSKSGVSDILEKTTQEDATKFLDRILQLNHESPLEHVNFTFAVEGVSRALTHQLVRHRIASFSQQSQRYVNMKEFEYIIPPEMKKSHETHQMFKDAMFQISQFYNQLTDELKVRYINEGMKHQDAEKKAIEDARYVLPNACETKIVFTMNIRSLLNFLRHRECYRAQWEIRQLAEEIMSIVKPIAPTLFKFAGAACRNGKCTEGEMSCGFPRK